MPEKTYPITFKGEVVGYVKVTGVEPPLLVDLTAVFDDEDNLAGFEVPNYG